MIKLLFAPVHYEIERQTVLFDYIYDTGLKHVICEAVIGEWQKLSVQGQSLLNCQQKCFSGVRVCFYGFGVIIYR